MASAKKDAPKLDELEQHAGHIRKELKAQKQSEVFRAAGEAGYLAALADGEVDATERATLARAVEILSEGMVIEWETDALLDDCAARAKKQGAAARAKAVGEELKALGQAEAGLYIGAVVARATNGVDKQEAEALKAVGAAAGLAKDKIAAIVKKAASFGA